MWLINTTTIKLHFVEDPSSYQYAILSHTWEDREVTFQDIADLEHARKKLGFRKIQKTCDLARNRGISFAWVDTCCIDKTSSAELTEAINSMYQWYKLSTVCFAFLSDLPNCELRHNSSVFGACRWFTRGWTLQELIASRYIEFYDKVWNLKGTKLTLSTVLARLTGVDENILQDSELVFTATVAKRMSWASSRQTTRVEDMSYCLFGLFDVHLPLIYGEGWKAFIRLQEAIILESSDLSIFAWKADFADQAIRGILAFSPSEFRDCGDIQRVDDPLILAPDFLITNKGVKIETNVSNGNGDYLMSLQCMDSKLRSDEALAIRLLKTARGYVRHKPTNLAVVSDVQKKPAQSSPLSICVPKTMSWAESQILRDRLAHRFAVKIINSSPYWESAEMQPQHLWDNVTHSFITENNEKFAGLVKILLRPNAFKSGQKNGLTLFVYVGLANNTEEGLRPWAAIYQHHFSHGLVCEDLNAKKVLIGNAFSSLADARGSLSLGAMETLPLPQALTPILEMMDNTEKEGLPHVRISLTLSTEKQPLEARYTLNIDVKGEVNAWFLPRETR